MIDPVKDGASRVGSGAHVPLPGVRHNAWVAAADKQLSIWQDDRTCPRDEQNKRCLRLHRAYSPTKSKKPDLFGSG